MKSSCPLFKEYPDIVNIDQLCEMLGGIGVKTAYELLHEGKIRYLKVGRMFKIPKCNVIEFVNKSQI